MFRGGFEWGNSVQRGLKLENVIIRELVEVMRFLG
jgi:hypothetical protein